MMLFTIMHYYAQWWNNKRKSLQSYLSHTLLVNWKLGLYRALSMFVVEQPKDGVSPSEVLTHSLKNFTKRIVLLHIFYVWNKILYSSSERHCTHCCLGIVRNFNTLELISIGWYHFFPNMVPLVVWWKESTGLNWSRARSECGSIWSD